MLVVFAAFCGFLSAVNIFKLLSEHYYALN